MALALLMLLLVVSVVVTAWGAHRAGEVEPRRAEALEAARTRVPELLSYDASRLEADLDRALEQTTGDFHDDYAKVLDDLVRPNASKRGITTTATVTAAGVVSSDGDDEVVVLVFLTQTTKSKGQQATAAGSRVEVTMQRAGEEWKIAELQPL